MTEENSIIDLDDNIGGNKNLPNSTAVLVLGIISIVGCFCYGIIGLVCGIIALVLYNKDKTSYDLNPGLYSKSTFNNLKAGYICGIIGLSLSAIYILILIIAIIGGAASGGFNPYDYR